MSGQGMMSPAKRFGGTCPKRWSGVWLTVIAKPK